MNTPESTLGKQAYTRILNARRFNTAGIPLALLALFAIGYFAVTHNFSLIFGNSPATSTLALLAFLVLQIIFANAERKYKFGRAFCPNCRVEIERNKTIFSPVPTMCESCKLSIERSDS